MNHKTAKTILSAIAMTFALGTASAGEAKPFGVTVSKSQHFGADNARQQTTVEKSIGKSNFSYVGNQTTNVTGGYSKDGSGSPITSNKRGSESSTTYGVGLGYRW